MFVGRERELAELVAALEGASRASGSLFLLAGEPGIGKTRLASEAAQAARERGVRPTWGRCWEAGGAPALWPWREACQALGLALPEASSIAASDPTEARFELFRRIVAELARAAASGPMLLVLEDLHAADTSTLLLLEFVASQLRTLPLTVVGTYRDLEAQLRAEVADSLARAGRKGRVLELARLNAPAVAALVHEALEGADEKLVATVVETTQGNPLFVDEVVRDIRVHGQRSGLPLGVREVIRRRLSLLSPEARALLEACAVLGVEFAASCAPRSAAGDRGLLDDALKSGVLVARGDRLRFSHALYREALYFDLPSARRQSMHREAARVLASTGAPLAELAHHLLEAGPEVLPEAVGHAVRAAAHAVDNFAFEDALAILERARAAIPPDAAHTALRCRVMIALGESKLRSGDATGRVACTEAAAMARALGDPVLLAHAGLAYGCVFLMGGVDPVLVSMLEEALAGLPNADSPLRARVMARLAAARQPSLPAERPRDIELGLAAIAMARRVANRRELLGVLHAASGVLYGKEDPVVRLPISLEQEALSEELGDTTRLLHARIRLANDYLELADCAGYARIADTLERLTARVGPAAGPWRVPLMRSMLALSRDDFEASERWQAEAQRLAGEQARARRALALHRMGYLRAAERHAELRAGLPELRGLWAAMPYGHMLADARVLSVLARIGADDEVRAGLAQLPDGAADEEINCASLADALWVTADRTLAKRLEPLLSFFGDRWQVYWFDCEIVDAPNTRSLAYLAAILGDVREAERLFERALASVEALGRRSLAARMRFEFGDLLLRLGHARERARALVDQARSQAKLSGLSDLVALIDRRHDRASQPAPSIALTMVREGEYYALTGTHRTLRFKASRGMQYLAQLLERPNTEVHVLELVGSADFPDRAEAGPLVDDAALAAYRARLEALRDAVEEAEALGDVDRAERARNEMEAIASELTRSTHKGGRARSAPSAAERARSAVQRRIKDALDRIAEQDPELGERLRRAVRTGNRCSFRPVP